jgi:hypothetical protein
MAGYTHTCAVCDAKLNVHERYVGRNLHCTECGTEFLADPSLIDDDTGGVDAFSRWVLAVFVLGIFGGLGWWIVQANEDFFADLFKPRRLAGHIAFLDLGNGLPVPAAPDSETVGIIVSAVENSDPGALQVLRAQGRLIEIASGTRVKVIERIRRDRAAKVRILVGPWTSRVVWVPVAALS